MNTEPILAFIILAQLGVIYGLVNRLIRQSGQAGMQAREAAKAAVSAVIGDDLTSGKVEPLGKEVRESYRIGV